MTAQANAGTGIDVTEHLALVRWVIRRRGFARRAFGALEVDDLMQEGALGLLRAARTFDPTKGAWATYASHWLRQSMGRSLQNMGSTVRAPVHLQERRVKAGERPRPVMRRLDLPISHDTPTTYGDLLADDTPSPEDCAAECERAAELSALMRRAKLTERERRVLRLRSLDVSLEDIGTELSLTRERVRQIEQTALERLRRAAGVDADAPRVAITRAECQARGGKRRNRNPSQTQPGRTDQDPCMRSNPQPESA